MTSRNWFRIIGFFLIGVAIVLTIGSIYLLVTRSRMGDGLEQAPYVSEVDVEPDSLEEPKRTATKRVKVIDDDIETFLDTSAATIGLALEEAGLEINYADIVKPPMADRLSDNETIFITRAYPYSINVDNEEIEVLSHYTKTADVLMEAGVGLIGYDFSIPSLESNLNLENNVEIIRVSEDILIEEIPISYETVWQGTDSLDIDQKGLLSVGVPGSLQKEIIIRSENGKEVSRSLGREWISRIPVNEVMGFGTRIEVRTMTTEVGTIEYWRVVEMRVTAYTAASAGKPPDHPAYGITASGVPAGTGVVAIDPKVVPFRSDVYVPGYGVAFAGDTGGGVKGRWIDLGYNDGEIVAWRGTVDVYYLTPVPPPDRINYLIPDFIP
jgi:3D (Asp-Asp-Asp) domain-containing protein